MSKTVYRRSNRLQSEMTGSPDKYPQGYFKEKPCRNCSTPFTPIAPSHLTCSQRCADDMSTTRYLTRNYNITLEDYNSMYLQQNGVCAICFGEGFVMAEHHKLKLVVDHCHSTGVVRGLLCHNCNRALGLLKDSVTSIKNAITYLEGSTTIP